ncbi:MAG TPA: HSP90 family protein [Mycobacteriales bacterium]|nr:HSP90 family protein [Mycobacteriales bacterium]
MTPESRPDPTPPPTPGPASGATHAFQVDLRGLVDLLSHHLYSSPRVYLRELLQNAVDAVTARRVHHPDAPTDIRIHAGGGTLRIDDTGIGLTVADVHNLLATIGGSSKRDGLESARREFLGQFGIGLLACFVVTDEVLVVSRSALHPDHPPVEWRARADGSYTVRTLTDGGRTEPGTSVTLTARHGSQRWLEPGQVVELARDFGGLLPYEITVVGAPGGPVRVTDTPPVWERRYRSPVERRSALAERCVTWFGFTPLDVIDLDVPLAGVRGVGYVLPVPTSPAQRARHRVHLKGMLLTDRADGLLPDWAFFVRCVIDTDSLRPTASREDLYDDEMLATVREALGARIRDWLVTMATGEPHRLDRFLATHQLAVKALALHDTEMLRVMLPWLPFETTDGRVSLDGFARTHPVVYLTRTAEEFRQVAPIAAAAGLGVVNGGYTYDAELVDLLPTVLPGATVSELDPGSVAARLGAVDPNVELSLAGFLATARAQLDPLGCDVLLRAFQPVSVPALHLDDRQARHERERGEVEAVSDELWAGILGALRETGPRAQLVLNHLNPMVRRIAAMPDAELAGLAVESVYGQALLMSNRPLRSNDTALLNRAFLGLLEWATRSIPTEEH